MASATSELLADRYHLEERIATGGMGVVWRARDHRLGRDVAIKLIRPEYADDPTFRQRLQLEARAIAAIRSTHVVRIHDVCEEHDPAGGYRAFLVMELVDGQPLSALLRDGSFPADRTAAVMSQAAAALAAAHAQQIIHRDIKPANLMVDSAGRVVVLDFGIARAADAVALTATDLILGTARYISPEQADGRGATAASDVYSLGVVAFECLVGNVPYDAGSDVATALAHLRDPIPSLPARVPHPIAALVTQMLAKSPGDRPSAAEVADRFGALSAVSAAEPLDETVAVAQPAQEPTAVMPLVLAARHRVQDRLAGRDLHETRSALLRPRLMMIPAVMAAVALIIAIALSSGSNGLQPSAAAGANSPHASHHATVTKVRIDPSRYVGRPWTAVRSELSALGVHPKPHFTGAGTTTTVVGLAPAGKVAKGSTITVIVSRTHPAPHPAARPAAHPAPKPKPPAPKPAGPHGHGPPGHERHP
ncbi:MAG TPA: serine/threonine-protein kinase [Mycobacteriales bacterium]|nr:serine/threonine-protein kinase [Mycobacteriales bacterium]